jgi:hypothetical protein
MAYLYSRRLIVRGAKGPEATEAARRLLAKAPPSTAWHPHELAAVSADYREVGPTALAERLGRTPGAVSEIARKLGVVRPRPRGQKKWTAAEISIVRELFPTANEAELLAALPGRTMASVNAVAYPLGLRRPGIMLWQSAASLRQSVAIDLPQH